MICPACGHSPVNPGSKCPVCGISIPDPYAISFHKLVNPGTMSYQKELIALIFFIILLIFLLR